MRIVPAGQENTTPIELYDEDHGSGPAVVLLAGWPLGITHAAELNRELLAFLSDVAPAGAR